MNINVHPTTAADLEWVEEVFWSWGADFVVTRGRKVYPTDTEGFYAADTSGDRVGLVTYQVTGDQCEIVTLDAFVKFRGIGTALMDRVAETVRQRGCRRLWLITTNDNLDAIRFYQKRAFTIAAVHVNSLEESRRLKPVIPKIGQHGIPLRDEIEFEKWI